MWKTFGLPGFLKDESPEPVAKLLSIRVNFELTFLLSKVLFDNLLRLVASNVGKLCRVTNRAN